RTAAPRPAPGPAAATERGRATSREASSVPPSRHLGARPFVGIDLPAAARQVAAIALRIAHADLRLTAVGGTAGDGGDAVDAVGQPFHVADQEADMSDAKAALMAGPVVVEGLDRHVGMAIADMAVAIARFLELLRMGKAQIAEAEHGAVEIEAGLGIECVERHMGDARQARLLAAGQPEIALGQADRLAFRIVDAQLAMAERAALAHHRAARTIGAIARLGLGQRIDGDADAVPAFRHIGLAELAAQAEKRQRVDAVGKGDVALRRAAALAQPEILAIEARQRLGIAAQCRDIADGRFHTRPSPFQGSFAEAGRLGPSYEAAPFLAAALAATLPGPAIEQDQRAQPADAAEAEMLD